VKNPSIEVVRRAFELTDVEVRQGEGEEPSHIRGHAAVFNKLSLPLGGFRERIRPGAFTKTIKEADVRALWNHDRNFVLGRTKSKTLELREDAKGLFFEAQPPDTSWARDVMVTMERGDVDQASFAFRVIREEWSNEGDETKETIRELIEVELRDVSPVTFPAYTQTDAKTRSVLDELGIDWEALAGALTRSQHGLELYDGDLVAMRNAIDVLNRSAGTSAPGQGPHPEAGDGRSTVQGRLEILRRQLELQALEV